MNALNEFEATFDLNTPLHPRIGVFFALFTLFLHLLYEYTKFEFTSTRAHAVLGTIFNRKQHPESSPLAAQKVSLSNRRDMGGTQVEDLGDDWAVEDPETSPKQTEERESNHDIEKKEDMQNSGTFNQRTGNPGTTMEEIQMPIEGQGSAGTQKTRLQKVEKNKKPYQEQDPVSTKDANTSIDDEASLRVSMPDQDLEMLDEQEKNFFQWEESLYPDELSEFTESLESKEIQSAFRGVDASKNEGMLEKWHETEDVDLQLDALEAELKLSERYQKNESGINELEIDTQTDMRTTWEEFGEKGFDGSFYPSPKNVDEADPFDNEWMQLHAEDEDMLKEIFKIPEEEEDLLENKFKVSDESEHTNTTESTFTSFSSPLKQVENFQDKESLFHVDQNQQKVPHTTPNNRQDVQSALTKQQAWNKEAFLKQYFQSRSILNYDMPIPNSPMGALTEDAILDSNAHEDDINPQSLHQKNIVNSSDSTRVEYPSKWEDFNDTQPFKGVHMKQDPYENENPYENDTLYENDNPYENENSYENDERFKNDDGQMFNDTEEMPIFGKSQTKTEIEKPNTAQRYGNMPQNMNSQEEEDLLSDMDDFEDIDSLMEMEHENDERDILYADQEAFSEEDILDFYNEINGETLFEGNPYQDVDTPMVTYEENKSLFKPEGTGDDFLSTQIQKNNFLGDHSKDWDENEQGDELYDEIIKEYVQMFEEDEMLGHLPQETKTSSPNESQSLREPRLEKILLNVGDAIGEGAFFENKVTGALVRVLQGNDGALHFKDIKVASTKAIVRVFYNALADISIQLEVNGSKEYTIPLRSEQDMSVYHKASCAIELGTGLNHIRVRNISGLSILIERLEIEMKTS